MDDWKSKVYACESIDGGVSVITPAKEYDGTKNEWLSLHELNSVEYIEMYPIQLPADRYFRDAWQIGEDRIEIDVPKARKIRLADLKEKRARKFLELDQEFIQAIEEEDLTEMKKIRDHKKKLRAMPDDPILKTDDLEVLRHAMPDYLR